MLKCFRCKKLQNKQCTSKCLKWSWNIQPEKPSWKGWQSMTELLSDLFNLSCNKLNNSKSKPQLGNSFTERRAVSGNLLTAVTGYMLPGNSLVVICAINWKQHDNLSRGAAQYIKYRHLPLRENYKYVLNLKRSKMTVLLFKVHWTLMPIRPLRTGSLKFPIKL